MFRRAPHASVMRGIDFPTAVSSKRIARSSIDPEAAHTKWCVAGHPANAEMFLRDTRERLILGLGCNTAGGKGEAGYSLDIGVPTAYRSLQLFKVKPEFEAEPKHGFFWGDVIFAPLNHNIPPSNPHLTTGYPGLFLFDPIGFRACV